MVEIFDGGEKASVYEILELIAYMYIKPKCTPSPTPINAIKPLYMRHILLSYIFSEIVFAVALQVRSCLLFRAVFVLAVARTSQYQNQHVHKTNKSNAGAVYLLSTVKPVLSGHSKLDKTKIFMINGCLMKVEGIAECSPWSILQYF